ncbi:hypothetical protein [Algoriphagus boritolerans]|uniref:hypothetical protein n=1 Tax=Algoriphagus boritolerans TaxID=308111 RepID=UPI000AC3EDFD
MTFILALTFGCSVKKFIPEDEYLYTGATLELKSGDDINDIKEVTEEVEALLRPEPNKKNTWDVRWALGLLQRHSRKTGIYQSVFE